MENLKTCAYSGKALSGNVKPEHIIQAGLGGRITSCKIMSSEVNESLSKIDSELVLKYYPVMHGLYFHLPRSARPGKLQMDLPGGGKLFLDKGRIRLKNNITNIVLDDHPARLVGDVRRLPEHLKEKLDPTSFVLFSGIKDDNGDNLSFEGFTMSPNIDTAILKIAASSAAYIATEHRMPFLLHAAQTLCSRVYKSLQSSKEQSDLISDHFFGFQVEPAANFDRLIQKIWGSKKKFAHYVFCYSNPIRRTIDVFVYLFGTEAFGVRVANRSESSFGYAIENGVLKDESYCIQCFEPDDDTEIQYTNRKSIVTGVLPNAEAVLDLFTESMESLIAEAEYYSEAFSFEHFVQSLDIAYEYWHDLAGKCGYQSIGEYLAEHVVKYFNPINVDLEKSLTELRVFDHLLFREDRFLKSELFGPFQVYSLLLQRLNSRYGTPRRLRRRPRSNDIKIHRRI